MKKYYAERKGLIEQNLKLNLKQLLDFFYDLYTYFQKKDYFRYAVYGIYENGKQIYSPCLAPSPEVYFAIQLQSGKVYPIEEYYERYKKETLFSVIEILYDCIAYYNFEEHILIRDAPRKEYCEHINNILRFYENGYYLEPQNGFVMEMPNVALKEQLAYDGSDMEDTIYQKLCAASEMFYRFGSSEEMKQKAINILADILENVRIDVKNILNEEYEVNKNDHDSMIFQIVNQFNIRHNNEKQMKDYSKEIWYEWMMQYYTSVIIAYYKLKKKREDTV